MSQAADGKNLSEDIQGAEIEGILNQWRRERPDLDPTPMAVCGDIWRAGERLRQGVLDNIKPDGLDMAGLDVLLTLRRQGEGETLSPSELAKDMMLSTSAMTNRLDRLEKKGLLARHSDPGDRRSLQVGLTEEGYALADRLVATHVAREESMLSATFPGRTRSIEGSSRKDRLIA